MWVQRKQSSRICSMCVPVCRIFPLTLSDRRVWCFVVLQCVGCGHHGSVKVISYSFSPNVSPHIPCPQHASGSRVGPLVLRDQTALSSPGPFACSFISSVSVSDCVGVSGAGVPLLSLTPLSLALSPAHPPSVCWRGPGSFWALALGPLCVCVSFAPPNPAVMCYRWDLRLSVSASAARRRRKQDARGSTVISQCALFHTIPGRSLYSLHAGPPLDIYMCQQSHRYWPT